MSLLPNQSAVNPSTTLWQPNNTLIATNTAKTTGAIALNNYSTLKFTSTINAIPKMSYYAYVNGSIAGANVGATSNYTVALNVSDPNGYTVSTPPLTVTNSNASAMSFTLPFVAQSPNTQLALVVTNTGSANTMTATPTLYTNSVISPLGENVAQVNFFQ